MKAFRTLTLSLMMAFGIGSAHAWEPPANPNPENILNEALADAAMGLLKDAAQKHVWYHDNVLRLMPEHAGVRLSFALQDWLELARRYPPAKLDMLAARDRAIERTKTIDRNLSAAMLEVVRMNEMLGDAQSTRDTFARLAERDSATAARYWLMALPALVRLQDYKLANANLPLLDVLSRIESQYAARDNSLDMPAAQRASAQAQMVQYVDLTLARVIWVLLNSQRTSEAQDVARRGRALLGPTTATPLINLALQGGAPPASNS